MRAPTEKANDTIQIVVTRACNLGHCSNCTQLLPFRTDRPHMGVDCFRAAVQSVSDWPGVVGIFGGNPCAHPRFEDLCAILCEEIPEQRRRGLWSNAYLGHGSAVRETFYPHGRFNLNAHRDTTAAAEIERWTPGMLIPGSDAHEAWHAGILLDWRDLGLTQPQWVEKRDRCDVNQNWSAGIVERDGQPFAYFCEIAAALDGVRGENHGIPAMPGWWRETMPRFAHQVEACCDRGCGVPLRARGHVDRDETYDCTPRWLPILEARRTRTTITCHRTMPEQCIEATDYERIRTPREGSN